MKGSATLMLQNSQSGIIMPQIINLKYLKLGQSDLRQRQRAAKRRSKEKS